MSLEIIAILVILLLFALFIWGVEIGFAMAITGFLGFAAIVNVRSALDLVAMDFYSVFSSYSLVVIPLFVVGLVAGRKSRGRMIFFGGLVVVHTFVSLVFHGSLRMRIPIEPVMAMFAADAAWRLVTRLRIRRVAR